MMRAKICDNGFDRFAYFWFQLLRRESYSSTSRYYTEINAYSVERTYEIIQQIFLFDRRSPQRYICHLNNIKWEYIHVNMTYGTMVIRGARWNKPFEIVVRNVQAGTRDVTATGKILDMFGSPTRVMDSGRMLGTIAGTRPETSYTYDLSSNVPQV